MPADLMPSGTFKRPIRVLCGHRIARLFVSPRGGWFAGDRVEFGKPGGGWEERDSQRSQWPGNKPRYVFHSLAWFSFWVLFILVSLENKKTRSTLKKGHTYLGSRATCRRSNLWGAAK